MAPGLSGILEITLQLIPGPSLILPPEVLLRTHTGRALTPTGLTRGHTLPSIIPSIGRTQVWNVTHVYIIPSAAILAANDGVHAGCAVWYCH